MTSIEAAVAWVVSLLSGSLMTSLLTIAVAMLAFGMLLGKMSFRRAGQIVLGSFILVSSVEISRGMTDFVPREQVSLSVPEPVPQNRDIPPAPRPVAPRSGNPFDPYAGSVAAD